MIPVMSMRHLILEESRLDRQQRRAALRPRRLTVDWVALTACATAASSRRRLPLEYLTWRDLPADCVRSRHQLQAQYRIAAQRKEVVVAPHSLDIQQVAPDLYECLLDFTLNGASYASPLPVSGSGNALRSKLAVCIEW